MLTSPFNLSFLDGSNGFVINGIDSGDFSGSSVSGAGDVNGDGIDDLIIGTSGTNYYGYYIVNARESYVVFGSSNGFSDSLNLSDLDGSNGFTIEGISGNYSGFSVSGAGDINGDGIDDIIIGASSADSNDNNLAGESYVVFGNSNGFSDSLNLSDLDGSNGFAIEGIDSFDNFGTSVSSAGDINGDGIDDIIIGAPGANPNGNNNAGGSYVVFGSSNGFSDSLSLSDLDGSNGFAINGINENERSGRAVSGAGDLNGDGIDDLVIGASSADPNDNYDAGESYVVFGSSNGFNDSLNLSDLDGSNGFTIEGINSFDSSGRAVSGAGDLNGDGIDDLIIGAPGANYSGYYYGSTGESYVVFGSSNGFSDSLSLSDLDGSNGFVLNLINEDDSGSSGSSVSSAGDVNGDGIDDLIIGAPGANYYGSTGESYVVFGSSNGFSDSLNLGDLDGSNGFIFSGIGSFDNFGSSVSEAGDINGDGIDDIIIGAPDANPNGNINAGESYVVFGTDAELLVGTEADELLTGTVEDDIIYGLAGSDTIDGLAGDDNINGGSSNDLVFGDLGNDTISGNEGDDRLFGNGNNDSIEGGVGNDILSGNGGNDTIFGNEGSDRIIGGLGDDLLEGGSGNDRVIGSDGNDTLIGVALSSAESMLGRGERDVLVNNRENGSNTFVLGNETGVFYNDGDSNTTGEADFARILGFNSANDTIQLSGSADLYRLEFASRIDTERANGRLLYTPESTEGELVAKLVNVSTDLTIDDSAFTFV